MKRTNTTSRRISEESAAGQDEVAAAVKALTGKELWRLKQYALWRIRGLGRASLGRNEEDLLQQAVTDTLTPDKRRWNKNAVDFFRHLIGAMRSISSHWRVQFDSDEAFSESEVISVSPDGKESNPLLQATLPTLDGRRVVAAKDEVEHIEQLVADHPLASLIIDGMRDRMSGPEIQEALGVSQKEYETAMRWLRRTVRANVKKEGTHA